MNAGRYPGKQKLQSNLEKALFLSSLSNAARLDILSVILEREASVGELARLTQLSQSAMSQHLAILRQRNIVLTRRDAQTIYYYCSNGRVRRIFELLKETP